MAIAEDSSAPAIKHAFGLSAANPSASTASFSPPANSLVVVLVNFGWSGSGHPDPSLTVQDSNSVSYSAGPAVYDTQFDYSGIYTHYYSSAPGSITVNVSSGVSTSGGAGYHITTKVLTGAASSQTGAGSAFNHSASGTSTAVNSSITTTTAGSAVYLCGTLGNNSSFSAFNSSTTIIEQVDDTTDILQFGSAKQTSLTSSPGAITLGFTATVPAAWSWAALEILPASGGSAFNRSLTATAAAQASFGGTKTTFRSLPPAATARAVFGGYSPQQLNSEPGLAVPGFLTPGEPSFGGSAGSASDNFTRANGSLGSNWTDWSWSGASGAQISGNNAVGSAGVSTGDYWNASTFSNNQTSSVTVSAVPTGSDWVGVTVRQSGVGGDGYLGLWSPGSGGLFMLFKENGTNTPPEISQVAGSLSPGDTLAVQATGTTISVLHNGTQVLSSTDSTYTSGAPGIAFFGSSGAVSAWQGSNGTATDNGTVTAAVTAAASFGGRKTALRSLNPAAAAHASFTVAGTASGAVTSRATAHAVFSGTKTAFRSLIPTATASASFGGSGSGIASDSFGRANGSLGSNWTDWSWAGASGAQIVSHQATGSAGLSTGDYWNANTFGNDQFSQVTVATVPSGSDWVGITVRQSGNGGDGYMALWTPSGPTFSLYKENGSSSPVLLTSASGSLSGGDTFRIEAVGTTVTVYHNGIAVITQTDASFTSGAPGIAFFGGSAAVSAWSGGNNNTAPSVATTSLANVVNGVGVRRWLLASGGRSPYTWALTAGSLPAGLSLTADGKLSGTPSGTGTSSFTVQVTDANSNTATASLSVTSVSAPFSPSSPVTDGNGVITYSVTSAINQNDAESVRVLTPVSPGTYAHGFLITLPVAAGTDNTTYGDGLDTVRTLGLHNTYNLTVVEPSTGGYWLADNPSNSALLLETYLLQVVAWAKANYAVTGFEKVYLIGFSRTGTGGQGIFFHWPDVFAGVASWDFPAMMTGYDGTDPNGNVTGGNSAAAYGTQDNFAANYELTQANIGRWLSGQSLGSTVRVWIGGYYLYQADVAGYDPVLTAAGVPHGYAVTAESSHNWSPSPGWVTTAVQGLPLVQSRPPLTLSGTVDILDTVLPEPPDAVGGTVTQADYGGGNVMSVLSGTVSETPNSFAAAVSQADYGGTNSQADYGGGAVVHEFSGTTSETPNSFAATVSQADYGGTNSQADYGGGTVVNELSGTTSETPNVLAGTISGTIPGGTISLTDFGGSVTGWTMQNVNLNFAEFNDITLSVTITSNGSALNLTGYTVKMLLKPSAGIVDTDGRVITLSSSGVSPAITVTNASAGQCTIAITHADVQDQTLGFYRIDAVDASGNINTAIYGNITYTAL